MKIASWNVNSLNVRLPHVVAWSEAARPDVLALQETKLTDDRFPVEELHEIGYHSVFSGQKTYNGVAILSREEASDPVTDIAGLDDPQRRILAATVGDIRIVNLYVVNGSEVGSEKFEYKIHWLEKVTDWLAAEMAQHEKLTSDTGISVYFCDPQSPWQRGSNENTNGLLRQYFPKGTDLSAHGLEELEAVAHALNSRPRKTLGWKTPAEALEEVLS